METPRVETPFINRDYNHAEYLERLLRLQRVSKNRPSAKEIFAQEFPTYALIDSLDGLAASPVNPVFLAKLGSDVHRLTIYRPNGDGWVSQQPADSIWVHIHGLVNDGKTIHYGISPSEPKILMHALASDKQNAQVTALSPEASSDVAGTLNRFISFIQPLNSAEN
jgi:hypothetical protein